MNLHLISTSAALALACASPAWSAETPAADPDNPGVGAATVDEMVVSAARQPEPLGEVGQSVTVLDRATIEASQALSVSDLIAQTPGVSVSRNGGLGTTTQVRIRGAESDQTVMVVDGVKLNDPASADGSFNFGDLVIGDVDRIEVLRGPQSTLWGSQAMGGVVAVTTRQPTAPLEGELQAEGGVLDTGLVKGGLGGQTGAATWRIAGESFTTEGFSAYRPGSERDGDQNSGASASLLYKLTDNLSVDLRGLYGFNHFDFDAASADSRDAGRARDLVGYAGLNLDLFGGRLKNRLAATYTGSNRYQYNPTQPVTPTTFQSDGTNSHWEYQGIWTLASAWTATFGAEDERQAMQTRSPTAAQPSPAYTVGHARLDSLYAQLQGEVVKDLTLTVGVREDDHSAFGHHTVGQAALAWSLDGGDTVLRTSWGQGFKAPTLYQLFSANSNPALKPETDNAWDAGVERRMLGGKLVGSLSYFHRDTANQIDFVFCPDGNPLCDAGPASRLGYYANTTRTRAQGVEAAATVRLTARLSLDANYTWTDAVDDTPGPSFGKRLPRRPENAGEAWLTYLWPDRLSTTLAVRYSGPAFDQLSNAYVLKSYAVVDLRASYPLTDHIELYGRVENAGDAVYELARNYGVPRRGVFAGVRARF